MKARSSTKKSNEKVKRPERAVLITRKFYMPKLVKNSRRPLSGLLVNKDGNLWEFDLSVFDNLNKIENAERYIDLKKNIQETEILLDLIENATGFEVIRNSTNFVINHNLSFTDVKNLFRERGESLQQISFSEFENLSVGLDELVKEIAQIHTVLINELNRFGKGDVFAGLMIAEGRYHKVSSDIVRLETQKIIHGKAAIVIQEELQNAVNKFKEIKANTDYSKEFELQLKTIDEQREENLKPVDTVAERKKKSEHSRDWWFGALLKISSVYAIALTLSVYLNAPENSIFSLIVPRLDGVDTLIVKAILLLPLAIMLLRYSHYARLFKVYSNLEEQYRHKNLVAKTTAGLLKAFQNGDAEVDQELLSSLRKEAAKAIMEQKSIGHLGGKEQGGIFGEIFKGL